MIATQAEEATKWISTFEMTVDAWQVADRLLQEVPQTGVERAPPYQFFGAKMLYSKIQRNFSQLSAQQVPGLMDSIVQHIINLCSLPTTESVVFRYLCLSLAALALQSNQPGAVEHILTALSPIILTHARVLLELLEKLPEEANNNRADTQEETRILFSEQLLASAPQVFAFLANQWPSANSTVKVQILLCLEKWMWNTDVSGDTLLQQSIFIDAFSTLVVPDQDPDLFQQAGYVVCVTLSRFYHDMNIVSKVVPFAIQLRSAWTTQVQILEENDLDDGALVKCRTISQIFSELGEFCLPLIFSHSEMGQGEILAQILECAKFKFNLRTASLPLRFLYDLREAILRADNERSEDEQRLQANSALVTRFKPAFVNLLSICVQQVQVGETHFVPADTKANHKVAIKEDEEERRMEFRESVSDCCYVLGPDDCLKLVGSSMQQQLVRDGSRQQWAPVEAHLYVLCQIIGHVAEDESVVLPWLMEFLFGLPEVSQLNTAKIATLGYSAYWLSKNTAYLERALTQLATSLRVSSTCDDAALSLQKILVSCKSMPGLPFAELHTLVVELRDSKSLSMTADLYLIEGLSKVISASEDTRAYELLQTLVTPIATSLAAAFNGAVETTYTVSESLDRLTTALRFAISDRDVASSSSEANFTVLFVQCLPLLQKTLEVNSANLQMCEKVCRCYKHSIRNCGDHFLQYLVPMSEHLSFEFDKHCISSFLYVATVMFKSYGMKEAQVPALYSMLWKMSSSFFASFSSLDHFVQKPDVVEDYYYLVAEALKRCPGPLLSDVSKIQTLLSAGILGLQLEHRQAQEGILNFFQVFIELPTFCPRGVAIDGAFQAAAHVLVVQTCPALVDALFKCLTGQMPLATTNAMRTVVELIYLIKCLAPDTFPSWAAAAVAALPQLAKEEAERSNLVSLLYGATSRETFEKCLWTFEWRLGGAARERARDL